MQFNLVKYQITLYNTENSTIFNKRTKKTISRISSGFLAELLMVLGYYLFEACLYGIQAPLVNIPANAVQGAAGLLMGIILIQIFEKNHIHFFD